MPRRALAQHFLEDEEVLGCIVQAADLSPKDIVVEVGPGWGVLTRELIKRVERVVAVEIDSELAAGLAGNLGDPPNLTVLKADARTLDLAVYNDYKVVANLPYYAANFIVRRFLEEENKPLLMVVTVQKEVAESMVALPGKMGLLSVGVQFYGVPRIVCMVPPEAFRPRPKVDSAVVRVDVLPAPAVEVDDVAEFFRLVQAGFAAPRKQIHNSLALGLRLPTRGAGEILHRAGIEPQRRPATLNLKEWAVLHRTYQRGAVG